MPHAAQAEAGDHHAPAGRDRTDAATTDATAPTRTDSNARTAARLQLSDPHLGADR